MNDDPWRPRKVVIVGAGAVGSAFAYALAQSGLADEIALRDANHELAMGQVLDLAHGQAFFPSVQIREAQAADYADARMIVITAGAKQRPGEPRLDLLQRNIKIIHEIIDEIVLQNSPAVVLIVSNPVDLLTYFAHKRSGWPRGTGHPESGSRSQIQAAHLVPHRGLHGSQWEERRTDRRPDRSFGRHQGRR